jgi:hypothetical protein
MSLTIHPSHDMQYAGDCGPPGCTLCGPDGSLNLPCPAEDSVANFMQVGYPRISWERGDLPIERVYEMMASMPQVQAAVMELFIKDAPTAAAGPEFRFELERSYFQHAWHLRKLRRADAQTSD